MLSDIQISRLIDRIADQKRMTGIPRLLIEAIISAILDEKTLLPKTDKPLVYVAGPYGQGDVVPSNVRRAIEHADRFLAMGFIPIVPHLCMVWEAQSPKPYSEWLRIGATWLLRCDVLFRIPGDSPGADMEVALAKEHGIPVCLSLQELEQWIKLH
jgi:hypothetical protein